MSRRRKSASAAQPAKVGAAGQRKLASTVLMLACTAIMLPLVFPPFYCFFLAPVALVPFCVCIVRRPLQWRFLLAYYLLGVAFFLPNLFWLAPVTVGGFIGLSLYVALYFAVFAFGVHRLVIQLRLPATLAVPLVWTGVEYFRTTFIQGGFPWFMLGNCLTPMPVLIQAADIFGVWGLTFFLALLNGFVVDFLRLPLRQVVKGQRPRFSPVLGRLTAAVSLLTAAWVAYGVFRLSETTTRPGPRVAVIQENVPQSLKDSAADQTLLRYMQLSEAAANATPKPDLVAWPETMVTAAINPEWFGTQPEKFAGVEALRTVLSAIATREQDDLAAAAKVADPKLRQEKEQLASYAAWQSRIVNIYKALGDQAAQHRVALLLGYAAVVPQEGHRPAVIQNRTLLLMPEARDEAGLTRTAAREYSKRHLVPFGEYIPFRGVPVLDRLMLMFSPVDYDYSNTPGTEWTRFRLAVGSRSMDAAGTQISSSTRMYEFGTPICFEDVMPEPAREMVRARGEAVPKADFLVNVSNDGWFHWVELDQHLQACQLRAVENRVAIARSVNTGNSGFVDSNGRIVKLVRGAGGNSMGAVGTESWVMEIDSRVTFFSRIGDLFPIICGILSTVLVGWTLVRPRRAGAHAAPSGTAESA